jgi:hypothetical protein
MTCYGQILRATQDHGTCSRFTRNQETERLAYHFRPLHSP